MYANAPHSLKRGQNGCDFFLPVYSNGDLFLKNFFSYFLFSPTSTRTNRSFSPAGQSGPLGGKLGELTDLDFDHIGRYNFF
jgi:hypothetical protein